MWQRRSGKLSLDSSVKKHFLHGYSQGFIYCECTALFPSTSNSPPTTGSTAHNCARASLRPHSQDCLLIKNKVTPLWLVKILWRWCLPGNFAMQNITYNFKAKMCALQNLVNIHCNCAITTAPQSLFSWRIDQLFFFLTITQLIAERLRK